MTKKTISGLTDKGSVLSKTGQVILGDDSYEFGDITRTKLSELEEALEDWKGLEEEPLNKLFGRAMKDMDPKQRKNLAINLIQLAATALLTWGFVSNLTSAFALSVAWPMALRQTAVETSAVVLPLLPFGSKTTKVLWRTFLVKYATVKLFLGPLFLVLQGCGTLLWFRRYNSLVVKLSQRVVSKETRAKFPLLHKLLALLLAFVAKNVLLSSLLAATGMFTGGLLSRVIILSHYQ